MCPRVLKQKCVQKWYKKLITTKNSTYFVLNGFINGNTWDPGRRQQQGFNIVAKKTIYEAFIRFCFQTRIYASTHSRETNNLKSPRTRNSHNLTHNTFPPTKRFGIISLCFYAVCFVVVYLFFYSPSIRTGIRCPSSVLRNNSHRGRCCP